MQMVDFLNTNSAAITAIATVILVLITFYYAIITRGLLDENRKLRQAGVEPHVVAFIHPHHDIGGIVDLTIQNVGLGPAFDLSASIVGETTVLEDRGVRLGVLNGNGSFPTFPQGHKLTLFFAVGHQLLQSPLPQNILIVLNYRDAIGRAKQTHSKLSFEIFDGMTPEQNSLRRDTNNHLKSISNVLEKVARQLALVIDKIPEPNKSTRK